jgi:hypothetical protein
VPQQVSDWVVKLSEPVRQKPGLHASRQLFFQTDWHWIPPFIYRLSVTETGDMTSLRYQGDVSLPEQCAVAITEIEATFCHVTITEREQ